MVSEGKVYVPHSCSRGQQQCHVHFVLHGNSGGDFSLRTHKTRINNIAAQNNIIVVYP